MRLSCVQSDVVFGDPAANLDVALEHLGLLASEGTELVVFPECFLTGYCFESRAEALERAIPAGHATIRAIQAECDRNNVLAVIGFAEVDGERLYNTAALLEPGQPVRTYRKTHLPWLGLDRFVTPGQSLPVFDTRLGRIGMLICFDSRPPEASRALALQGADLIVLPTNWPLGAEKPADLLCAARACENRVFFASCNRIGTERGFSFIGRSRVYDVVGDIVADAIEGAGVVSAEVDLTRARVKRVERSADDAMEIMASRRPELYSPLVG